jgi:glycerophosphoryl diester phosphodiesterase
LLGREEIVIIAHRGASRDAPENTVAAFALAWEQGADGIEGDFRQTRDGHIVCIHDKDTKRVAGTTLVVAESSLAELRELDVGSHSGQEYAGAVIPTAAEVFAAVPPGKGIYIEVKSDESIAPHLVEQIQGSPLEREQVTVISFNGNVIRTLKDCDPGYKTLWLSSGRMDASGNRSASVEDVLDQLNRMGADGFSSSKDFLSEAFLAGAMAEGYECHVWTVDDPISAELFWKWGVKSITTNCPCDIRMALVERDLGTAGCRARL